MEAIWLELEGKSKERVPRLLRICCATLTPLSRRRTCQAFYVGNREDINDAWADLDNAQSFIENRRPHAMIAALCAQPR